MFFQHRCESRKSVILNKPPSGLLYFSTLRAWNFRLERYVFQLFFRRHFQDILLLFLSEIAVQIGDQIGPGMDEKNESNVRCFFNDFWMTFRGSQTGSAGGW